MLKISASLAAVYLLWCRWLLLNRPFGVNVRYDFPVLGTEAHWIIRGGGSGWTGPTTCVQGSVCTFQNDFYSQCLPDGTATTTTGSGTTAALPTGTSTVKSNTVAKSLGKKLYFGSATDNPELTDAAYVATLSDNTLFGQLTPGKQHEMAKHDFTRTQLNHPEGDTIAALAKKNGQLLRGHNCVWYNQLPSWVSSGGFNATTLTSILQTHCSTVVKHYAGQMSIWCTDSQIKQTRGMLSNEPFNDDGTVRSFVFSNALGLDYVTTALINDYNIDSAGSKATAMINLVKSLKAAGTPIDGIGIQGHLIVGQ
ncbi:glycoside hydrolase superfamily [Mycena olivaceomarginata]|nr:glycoside hydrolase superfamily [Mycena olivaceomarginata]